MQKSIQIQILEKNEDFCKKNLVYQKIVVTLQQIWNVMEKLAQ